MFEPSADILHIIPEDGVGGVEFAARSGAQMRAECHVLFLAGEAPAWPEPETARISYACASHPFHLAAIWQALKTTRRLRSNVVVFSLWKSFGAFLTLRLLQPRLKFVLLLHSERDVHWPDRIFTRIMARLSHAIFLDSAASLARLSSPGNHQTRVVSYLRNRVQAAPRRSPKARFIYWGRLQQLKNLPAAINLFAEIAAGETAAEFVIIGPNVGMKSALQRQVTQLGLERQVFFEGMRSWPEICRLAERAHFFLQLSFQEGMAMSVVEAMQLGLVVVVTPVGEIANYCRDMANGVIFTNRAETSQQDPAPDRRAGKL